MAAESTLLRRRTIAAPARRKSRGVASPTPAARISRLSTGSAPMSPTPPLTFSRVSTAMTASTSAPNALIAARARASRTPTSSAGLSATTSAATPAGTDDEAVRVGGAGADISRSASDVLESLAKGGGLVRGQFDNEPATTFERHAHHDAASLFGDLERTVARPRLHGRHARSLSTSGTSARNLGTVLITKCYGSRLLLITKNLLITIIAENRGQKETAAPRAPPRCGPIGGGE